MTEDSRERGAGKSPVVASWDVHGVNYKLTESESGHRLVAVLNHDILLDYLVGDSQERRNYWYEEAVRSAPDQVRRILED